MRSKSVLSDYNRYIAKRKWVSEYDSSNTPVPLEIHKSMLGVFGASEAAVLATFTAVALETHPDTGYFWKTRPEQLHDTSKGIEYRMFK